MSPNRMFMPENIMCPQWPAFTLHGHLLSVTVTITHGNGISITDMSQNGAVNSLVPGRSKYDSKNVIFNLVLLIGIFRSSHDNALRWMPWNLTNDKSRLIQVMAWCRQATSHYLSQCWLSSLSPYGVTRPQWVNVYYVLWYCAENNLAIIYRLYQIHIMCYQVIWDLCFYHICALFFYT